MATLGAKKDVLLEQFKQLEFALDAYKVFEGEATDPESLKTFWGVAMANLHRLEKEIKSL